MKKGKATIPNKVICVANGVEDRHVEESATKIAALERERDELASDNAARKEEIKKLTAELEGLRSDGVEMREKMEEMQGDIARSKDAVKAAEVIAARAADLETEVARLQHDTISEMLPPRKPRNDAEEIEEGFGRECESRVSTLERAVERVKEGETERVEVEGRGLERPLGALEMQETLRPGSQAASG
ncbi:putative peroxisomal and mitochondrial division factor 2-like [Sesbania bispinosa]|nr:putative peroxisomal and mitochondrial division factor 2-like [Sesbania bispinosa]